MVRPFPVLFVYKLPRQLWDRTRRLGSCGMSMAPRRIGSNGLSSRSYSHVRHELLSRTRFNWYGFQCVPCEKGKEEEEEHEQYLPLIDHPALQPYLSQLRTRHEQVARQF